MRVLWRWSAVVPITLNGYIGIVREGDSLESLSNAPRGNYVYVIGAFGTPLYVGNTVSPWSRLCAHLGPQSAAYSPVSKLITRFPSVIKEWKIKVRRYPLRDTKAESRAIKSLRPCLNIAMNNNPRPLPEPLYSLDLEYKMLINKYVCDAMSKLY